LESPGLDGWGGDSPSWEWWVVLVGSGGQGLAGLDGELGSVLHEFLGSTAAEAFVTEWSVSNVFVQAGSDGVVTEGAGSSVTWHGGLYVVVLLDFFDQIIIGGILVELSPEGLLSSVVSI